MLTAKTVLLVDGAFHRGVAPFRPGAASFPSGPAPPSFGGSHVESLQKKEEQLQKEKEQLRAEKLRQLTAQASLLTSSTQAYAVRQTVKRRGPRATGAASKKKFGIFVFCACFGGARVFGSCLGSCGAVFDLQICATACSWDPLCVRQSLKVVGLGRQRVEPCVQRNSTTGSSVRPVSRGVPSSMSFNCGQG